MKKRKAKKIKSDDVHLGDKLQTFKVRCSLENVFYMFVEAHDNDEAEALARAHCEERDREEDCFWESEASYKHSCFEAEET